MVLLRLSRGLFTVNPLEGCKIPKLIPDATNTPLINKTKDKTMVTEYPWDILCPIGGL